MAPTPPEPSSLMAETAEVYGNGRRCSECFRLYIYPHPNLLYPSGHDCLHLVVNQWDIVSIGIVFCLRGCSPTLCASGPGNHGNGNLAPVGDFRLSSAPVGWLVRVRWSPDPGTLAGPALSGASSPFRHPSEITSLI